MTPAEALDQIAFALERALAPSAKVKAFRRAHAVVTSMGEEELLRLAAHDQLTSLPGIGTSTSTVIAQALLGRTPAYLTNLQAAADPAPEQGRALRAALRGDCHSHSTWSDGGSSMLEMAMTAARLGHEYLVVTDHSPRLTVANGLTAQRLRAQWKEIDAVNGRLAGDGITGFRLLKGIEVDINEDGSLDQDADLLAQLDVVVGSVHSKLRSPSSVMTSRMLTAIANPQLDVLGHCTGRKVTEPTRPPSAFDAEAVFPACAEHDVAVEINSRRERQDPPRALLRQAVAAGCTFTVDTDAHAPGQLDWQWIGTARAAECGVSADRVLNTLGADALVARLAARHGG